MKLNTLDLTDAALKLKSSLGFEPDTVVIFSDMQVNHLYSDYGYGYKSRYSSRTANVAKLFSPSTVKIAVNLNGYESTPVSEIDGWYQLTGWSDRMFDFIPAVRGNSQSMMPC